MPLKPLPTAAGMLNMDTIYSRAKAMIEEQEDDVKDMNKMILFMKTLQIRDQ